MQIGTFRRNVAKTFTIRTTKAAMRRASKNTARVQAAQAAVALKGHTGQLLQTMSQYLLGLPQTEEMKQGAFKVLGDIGYDVAALARTLKVKLPSSTKKIKLVGTRSAAILQLDSLATDLLRLSEQSLFTPPTMTTVKRMVSLPKKGGAKEERDVSIVDLGVEQVTEAERQTQMKSFLAGATDVYWRLCFDLTGQPPVAVLDAKVGRLKAEYPNLTFDTGAKKVKAPVAVVPAPAPVKKKASKKKQAEAVPAGVS